MRTDLLSSREIQVLLLVATYRYLGLSHLEQFLFAGSATTKLSRKVMTCRVAGRLRARGLLAATNRLVGGPGGGSGRLALSLTKSGAKLAAQLNPDLPARRLTSSGTFLMPHALMTADVALAFRREARQHVGHDILEWESDWQARHRVRSSVLVPDAYFVYATPDLELSAFLEIDLGSEGSRFFARKILSYLDLARSGNWREVFESWPLILVVTPTERRADALRRAAEAVIAREVDAERIRSRTAFGFAALPRLLAAGPLGPIWRFNDTDGFQLLIPLVAHSHEAVD